MSEIVIRHAEPKDYDAIRQIHAQPECVPQHATGSSSLPSKWQARLTEQAGVKQTGCPYFDDIVVGHLSPGSPNVPAAATWPIFGILDARHTAALPAR